MRTRVFGLTWLSYATYYFARKSLPVVKATLASRLGLSTATLAVIDTGYLATYAAGQFSCGWLGDRVGARRLIGYGMLGSAAVSAAFGASSVSLVFVVLYALNGLFQASGWPGNIKAMAAWYGPKERGAVMGVWTTCFQVGPLLATALAAWLLQHHGWRSAFFGPSAFVAIVGLAVLLFLPGPPADQPASVVPAGLKPEARSLKPEAQTPSQGSRAEVRAAGRKALNNPVVWLLGASYFGLKLIRYCIDFWQPFYLERALGYAKDEAAYHSTAFQFGGIFGSIIVGFVSDRWFSKRRGAVAAVMTVLLGFALILYASVGSSSRIAGALALALVGFCLFGPDALISGVAAQDLGGRLAAATVAGFINGCGSVGAIAQGALVAGVSDRYGWQSVFHVLVGLAFFSSAALAVVWRIQARQARLARSTA